MGRCIDSILAQTYICFELLLVDDGSTDNSDVLCQNYVKQDKRVSYYKKQNGGSSDARNFGIEHTSKHSEYVCFIDSDDIVDPQYLEFLITAIGNAQLSMCHLYDIYHQDQRAKPLQMMKVIEYRDVRDNCDFVELFQSGILNSSCNKLFRRDIINRHSIRFPLDAIIAEDLIFNLRYLQYCECVNEVANALYGYIHRENSLVSRISPQAYESYLTIRNEMIDYWGTRFEPLIDKMIYRQFESISIKLIKQNKCKDVSRYISRDEIHEVIDNVHMTNRNDKVIHFLLSHNMIWLLMLYLKLV